MPTLKEVLADKAKYQDNLAWQLENGVSVTLGQLRQLSDEKQSGLTTREAAIAKANDNLTKAQADLTRAQNQTATAFDLVNRATEAIKAGRMNDPAIAQLTGQVINANNNGNDPFAELS